MGAAAVAVGDSGNSPTRRVISRKFPHRPVFEDEKCVGLAGNTRRHTHGPGNRIPVIQPDVFDIRGVEALWVAFEVGDVGVVGTSWAKEEQPIVMVDGKLKRDSGRIIRGRRGGDDSQGAKNGVGNIYHRGHRAKRITVPSRVDGWGHSCDGQIHIRPQGLLADIDADVIDLRVNPGRGGPTDVDFKIPACRRHGDEIRK